MVEPVQLSIRIISAHVYVDGTAWSANVNISYNANLQKNLLKLGISASIVIIRYLIRDITIYFLL